MTYFVMRNDGGIDGPFSVEDLRVRAEAGNLDEGALLEEVETKKRLAARSIPGLFDGISAQASAPVDLGPAAPTMPLIGGTGAPEVGSPASQTSGPNTPPSSTPQGDYNRPPVQQGPPSGGYSAPPPRMAPPVDRPMGPGGPAPGQIPSPGYANYPRGVGYQQVEMSPIRADKGYGWTRFGLSACGLLCGGIIALLGGAFLASMAGATGGPGSAAAGGAIGAVIGIVVAVFSIPGMIAGYQMAKGVKWGFILAIVLDGLGALGSLAQLGKNAFSAIIGLAFYAIFLVYEIRRITGSYGPPLN